MRILLTRADSSLQFSCARYNFFIKLIARPRRSAVFVMQLRFTCHVIHAKRQSILFLRHRLKPIVLYDKRTCRFSHWFLETGKYISLFFFNVIAPTYRGINVTHNVCAYPAGEKKRKRKKNHLSRRRQICSTSWLCEGFSFRVCFHG